MAPISLMRRRTRLRTRPSRPPSRRRAARVAAQQRRFRAASAHRHRRHRRSRLRQAPSPARPPRRRCLHQIRSAAIVSLFQPTRRRPAPNRPHARCPPAPTRAAMAAPFASPPSPRALRRCTSRSTGPVRDCASRWSGTGTTDSPLARRSSSLATTTFQSTSHPSARFISRTVRAAALRTRVYPDLCAH